MRSLGMFAVIAVSILVTTSAFGYSVSVNKVDDFGSTFSTLAMLPASCPPDVDCLWFEQMIQEKIRARGVSIVPVTIVRQWMFKLGIKEITPENRGKLAETLKVEAFVVAVLDSASTETSGTTGIVIGNIFTAANSRRSKGSVQMAIVSADDGRTLMEGQGFGESTARPSRGVIGKTCNLIFDRTFTPSFLEAYQK